MMTSVTFHTRSMPRRSCTITECRNAVAVNHGSRPAFSTGSQHPEAAPAELFVAPRACRASGRTSGTASRSSSSGARRAATRRRDAR